GDDLASVDEVRASRRDVVFLDGGDDLGDAHAGHGELPGIDGELEAPRLSAERVHLDDPGDEPEARRDLPLEHGPLLHERPVAFPLEVKDLAEPAGDRAELR